MEKIINDIYSQCEEKLDYNQIFRLISELETLGESKEAEAEKSYELSPACEVSKENCEAINHE